MKVWNPTSTPKIAIKKLNIDLKLIALIFNLIGKEGNITQAEFVKKGFFEYYDIT